MSRPRQPRRTCSDYQIDCNPNNNNSNNNDYNSCTNNNGYNEYYIK